MMQPDTVTLVVSATLFVLALLTPLLNPFFRRARIEKAAAEETAQEPITVLLTSFEQAEALERHLPLFLEQDYATDYQLVVVIEKTDVESENVLKRFSDNPRLYYTFIPTTSRYMNRRKLAITLGVKAAKHEWVLLADAHCRPSGLQWLKTMASRCREGASVVVGYTAYDRHAKGFYRFRRVQTAQYLFRQLQKGTPWRTNSSSVAFRRSEFLEQDGYRGNLKYLRGEFDFLVNKYAAKKHTIAVLEHDGWTIEDKPSRKKWRNEQLFYQATRKQLRRSFGFRFKFFVDQVALHGNLLLQIAAASMAVWTSSWLVAAAAGLSFLLTIVLRTLIARKTLRYFDLSLPLWKVYGYEIAVMWSNLLHKWRYLMADKDDFICHKI